MKHQVILDQFSLASPGVYAVLQRYYRRYRGHWRSSELEINRPVDGNAKPRKNVIVHFIAHPKVRSQIGHRLVVPSLILFFPLITTLAETFVCICCSFPTVELPNYSVCLLVCSDTVLFLSKCCWHICCSVNILLSLRVCILQCFFFLYMFYFFVLTKEETHLSPNVPKEGWFGQVCH